MSEDKKICPVMSGDNPDQSEWMRCQRDECAFWIAWAECCVHVLDANTGMDVATLWTILDEVWDPAEDPEFSPDNVKDVIEAMRRRDLRRMEEIFQIDPKSMQEFERTVLAAFSKKP